MMLKENTYKSNRPVKFARKRYYCEVTQHLLVYHPSPLYTCSNSLKVVKQKSLESNSFSRNTSQTDTDISCEESIVDDSRKVSVVYWHDDIKYFNEL